MPSESTRYHGRLSSVLADRQMPGQSMGRADDSDNNNTCMARPVVASSTHGNVSSTFNVVPRISETSDVSTGKGTSTDLIRVPNIYGMEGLRDRFRSEGLSKEAAELLNLGGKKLNPPTMCPETCGLAGVLKGKSVHFRHLWEI